MFLCFSSCFCFIMSTLTPFLPHCSPPHHSHISVLHIPSFPPSPPPSHAPPQLSSRAEDGAMRCNYSNWL